MSTYLQRLLDRAALATPPGVGILPAGPSHSPVSLSDQRLNDPGFAERYSPPADGWKRIGDTTQESPRPAPRRTSQRPATKPTPPEAAAPRPDPTPPKIPATSPETPVIEAARQVPPHYSRSVGFVDVADLVLPEPERVSERSATERNEAIPAPPPPVKYAPTEAQTDPTEPPLLQPREDSAPRHAPVEYAEATPSRTRPRAVPIPVAPAPDLPVPERPAISPSAPAPHPPVEVLPPPVDTPDLPDLPVPSPRQPDPATAPIPTVQAAQEPPKNAAAETRRSHPMTAAEASIIGTLTSRRRALTIFGLRRR